MATAKNAQDLTINFTRERETKNTVRFAEDVEAGVRPTVGTLYLLQGAVESLGSPDNITLTVSAS